MPTASKLNPSLGLPNGGSGVYKRYDGDPQVVHAEPDEVASDFVPSYIGETMVLIYADGTKEIYISNGLTHEDWALINQNVDYSSSSSSSEDYSSDSSSSSSDPA